MQSETNQGSSTPTQLIGVALHVTQVLVKPSWCVIFHTIPFLAGVCGHHVNMVGLVISIFWSHVCKSRSYILKSQTPLVRLYLDIFALFLDHIHFILFIRLKKLHCRMVEAFTGK